MDEEINIKNILCSMKSAISNTQNINIHDDLFDFNIEASKLRLEYLLNPKIGEKRKNIPAPLKRQVWETYISSELRKGKCFCCRNKRYN
jgi:hypothetical protein